MIPSCHVSELRRLKNSVYKEIVDAGISVYETADAELRSAVSDVTEEIRFRMARRDESVISPETDFKDMNGEPYFFNLDKTDPGFSGWNTLYRKTKLGDRVCSVVVYKNCKKVFGFVDVRSQGENASEFGFFYMVPVDNNGELACLNTYLHTKLSSNGSLNPQIGRFANNLIKEMEMYGKQSVFPFMEDV